MSFCWVFWKYLYVIISFEAYNIQVQNLRVCVNTEEVDSLDNSRVGAVDPSSPCVDVTNGDTTKSSARES